MDTSKLNKLGSERIIVLVLGLIFLGSLYGAVAVMCGMVIGQFLNLVIIHYYLRKEGVGLTPRYSVDTHQETSDLWMQYFSIISIGFFRQCYVANRYNACIYFREWQRINFQYGD